MDSLALPWLPPLQPSFSDEVRALRQAPVFDPAVFRRLATARLGLQQLTSLARALPKPEQPQPADSLRLHILSNATADLLLPALAATAPRHGIWLQVTTSAFGTYLQEALDPDSATHRARPDLLLLALDHRAIDLPACPGNAELAQQRVDAAIAQLLQLAGALRRGTGGVVILQTLAAPGGSLFGSIEGHLPGTQRWLIEAFNTRLRAVAEPGCLLLDVAALAGAVGADRWHDPGLWNLGKIACSQQVVPLYADHVCRLVMALRGKAKKCLVLDLDNTVWGGVIGDDGLAGIVLGQGSPTGEAHLAVQALALALRDRGIVLAVSSKNEDAIARLPFHEHPDMLLRESHIAAFQANWQDKASNLRAIAKALNIGVDALVLLDDNPAERHQVRTALPEVGVPELPEGPEFFAGTLLAAGYFDTVQFTAEDRDRAGQYQANAARTALLGGAADLQSHLASLDMVAQMAPFDDMGRARITQLINKTNQFNLTTRRRTEAEVAALEQDPSALTLQVRLKDRFGDNGMIAVLIALPDRQAEGEAEGQPEGHDWLIDTWLMSCRVLNRGVERAVLDVLVACARQRGVQRLIGHYRPTDKNMLVQHHYKDLGFTPVRATGTDTGQPGAWQLLVAAHAPQPTQIRVTLGGSLVPA